MAVGTRQHSQSLFAAPSGHTIIFLFFPRLLGVSKWGLLFDEGTGVAITGHSPSTGSDSTAYIHTHIPLTLLTHDYRAPNEELIGK
jgi:hypothetical protein